MRKCAIKQTISGPYDPWKMSVERALVDNKFSLKVEDDKIIGHRKMKNNHPEWDRNKYKFGVKVPENTKCACLVDKLNEDT